jgi:xylulokinase
VALVDTGGAEVAHAAVDTPFVATPSGVEAGGADLQAGVAAALARLGPVRARVAAVGVAGVAESGAPVDGAGRPLAPVIAWHDPRGGEVVARLEERFGADPMAARLGQRLRTVSSVAKLGWLVSSGVTGVQRWLGVPELILHALTGAMATDYSLAARTGAYDVAARRPWAEVLDEVGLPPEVFLPPAPAGTVMGKVSAEGAGWSGLPAGIPVTIAGHDHLAGALGSGAGHDDLVNSVGTAETVVGHLPGRPDVARALALRLAVTVRPTGEGWAVLASAARSGLVLAMAADLLGHPLEDLDRLAGPAATVDATALVDQLVTAARSSPVPPSGLDTTPSIPDATLPAGSPGEVWNGVLAALSARTWDAAGRVEQLCGPSRRLVVFGGGSRSEPWLQAKAAAGFLPVARSPATEAVARGAALTAGVAAGWWPAPPASTPGPRTWSK